MKRVPELKTKLLLPPQDMGGKTSRVTIKRETIRLIDEIMYSACVRGDEEVVRDILTGYKFSSEHFIDEKYINAAIINGHKNVVILLITFTSYEVDRNDGYALTLACSFGHTDIVRFLITIAGATIDINRNRALKTALSFERLEVVCLLINLGADKEIFEACSIISNASL